jgi:glycogen operon protein
MPQDARRAALGATIDELGSNVSFAVYSKNATRVELCLYAEPIGEDERLAQVMAHGRDGVFGARVPLSTIRAHGIEGTIYYGYRAWGPNWIHDAAFTRGSGAGFRRDVDDAGNRFNPNKLLLDPFAREISHDPRQDTTRRLDPNVCVPDTYTGEGTRLVDTGRQAPKGIVLGPDGVSRGDAPARPLAADVVYEVHLRGFTMLDAAIPEAMRGTYRGAGMKADYLRDLGVTAVEFLPVHEFADEQNGDGDPVGDNYWGYMTLGFFAPNRRYASDRSPGGPTREFKEMVRAFHERGIKVFLDVVYNHTAEGLLRRLTDDDASRGDDALQDKDSACLLSFAGLDNATYYVLRTRPADGAPNQRYQDHSACGGDVNVAEPAVRDLVLDSLRHWSGEMGVDGFRFDLAPILGNARTDGFEFSIADPDGFLNRAARDLPARGDRASPGVDLIAEPWALGDGTYQLGGFPEGWAEWNDRFRITCRQAENKLGVVPVPAWQLADALSGSAQAFRKKPSPRAWHAVNQIVAHDGYTLRDVYSFSGDGDSWDHGGDPALQRQAVRNGLALLMLSAGVPMITGGDELFRTLGGRTNTVAADDPSVYLDFGNLARWEEALARGDGMTCRRLAAEPDLLVHRFARGIIRFRGEHPCLRPARYFSGSPVSGLPGAELKDIAWLDADGRELDGASWAADATFLAWRVDGRSRGDSLDSVYAAYNRAADGRDVRLPGNLPGRRWYRAFDTAAWMEPLGNAEDLGTAAPLEGGAYFMHGRTVLVLAERAPARP